jgi:hypothetical protein
MIKILFFLISFFVQVIQGSGVFPDSPIREVSLRLPKTRGACASTFVCAPFESSHRATDRFANLSGSDSDNDSDDSSATSALSDASIHPSKAVETVKLYPEKDLLKLSADLNTVASFLGLGVSEATGSPRALAHSLACTVRGLGRLSVDNPESDSLAAPFAGAGKGLDVEGLFPPTPKPILTAEPSVHVPSSPSSAASSPSNKERADTNYFSEQPPFSGDVASTRQWTLMALATGFGTGFSTGFGIGFSLDKLFLRRK